MPCLFMDAYHLLHVSWFIESRFDGDPWGGRGGSSSRQSLQPQREPLPPVDPKACGWWPIPSHGRFVALGLLLDINGHKWKTTMCGY